MLPTCKYAFADCVLQFLFSRLPLPDSCFKQTLAALLISASPNLETLIFAPLGRFHEDDAYDLGIPGANECLPLRKERLPVEKLLMRANARPESTPYLQNLRVVKLWHRDDTIWDDGMRYQENDFLHSLSFFHRLPSIESVRIETMAEPDGRKRFRPLSSNVSKLHIGHSDLDVKYLTTIICTCKRLTEFTYSVGGRDSGDGSYALLDGEMISKALLFYRKTLEKLDIDVDHHLQSFPARYPANALPGETDYWDSHPFGGNTADHSATVFSSQTGSLRDFTALTELSIGVVFLFGLAGGIGDEYESQSQFSLVERLPPNLKYLCIRGYQKGDDVERDHQISQFMSQRRRKLPSLMVVEGVDEWIPNSEAANNHPELVFMDSEAEEWTDYEYE